jgi:YfiH family protein
MPEEPNLIGAFSHRQLGNMSYSYGDARDSLANRKSFLGSLGIDYRDLICARQIHSHGVRYVTELEKGKGALAYEDSIADTDALVTDKKNLPLAVLTADCLCVYLYDPLTPAIGLVHAGWRSCKENITACAVQYMQKVFGTQIPHLQVGFGPAIRSCCYEVSQDFHNYFSEGLEERSGRYYLDLAKVNRKQLFRLGVKPDHVLDHSICTSCRNKDFFSYRRDGKTCGRMMSVMMLR